jgi:ribosomal protein S18 acetylase RimI-like enzyme
LALEDLQIRHLRDEDMGEIVALSLLAWEPVFQSFKQILGPAIYAHIWPDWQKIQTEVVEKYCREEGDTYTLVAAVDAKVVGFVTYELKTESKVGEVMLLAVHPAHQNQEIGTELNNAALAEMKASGMKLAEVATGGDPGHAPARRSYEKAGYTGLPLMRYYKAL